MKSENEDQRGVSLRISRDVHKSLKTVAALMGRPIYDVASEAISAYLGGLKLADPLVAVRRSERSRKPT